MQDYEEDSNEINKRSKEEKDLMGEEEDERKKNNSNFKWDKNFFY